MLAIFVALFVVIQQVVPTRPFPIGFSIGRWGLLLKAYICTMNHTALSNRIHILTVDRYHQLVACSSYRELSELNKIPIRIMTAEIWALESLRDGIDLSTDLKWCVANEQYCGAEGIRRANNFIACH